MNIGIIQLLKDKHILLVETLFRDKHRYQCSESIVLAILGVHHPTKCVY